MRRSRENSDEFDANISKRQMRIKSLIWQKFLKSSFECDSIMIDSRPQEWEDNFKPRGFRREVDDDREDREFWYVLIASFRGLSSLGKATSQRLYADRPEIFLMTISWKDTRTVMRYDADFASLSIRPYIFPEKGISLWVLRQIFLFFLIFLFR
jgi:hypothetical protein